MPCLSAWARPTGWRTRATTAPGRTPGGGWFVPNLGDPAFRERLEADCLGKGLSNGVVATAGFFLGPSDFYRALRELPDDERRLINMTSVLRVNHLYDDVDSIARLAVLVPKPCVNLTRLCRDPEAIVLAEHIECRFLLINDWRERSIAKRRGVPIVFQARA